MTGIATTEDGARHLTRLRADELLPAYDPIVLDADGRVVDGDPARARVLWRRVALSAAGVETALGELPNLEVVHNDTVGLDTLPLTALRARGLRVTVPETAYAVGMSEWLITAVLWRCKRLSEYQRASDAGRWEHPAQPRSVAGTRIACWGAGRMVRRAITPLSLLGADLVLTARRQHRDASVRPYDDWLTTLPDADFLVLAAPLTDTTRHAVDDDMLGRLDGACLINLARGELLAPGALARARENGNVAAAVLDAHPVEPLPADDPAWTDPDVLVLPHDTWRYRGVGRAQGEDFARAVCNHLDGRGRYADVALGY